MHVVIPFVLELFYLKLRHKCNLEYFYVYRRETKKQIPLRKGIANNLRWHKRFVLSFLSSSAPLDKQVL